MSPTAGREKLDFGSRATAVFSTRLPRVGGIGDFDFDKTGIKLQTSSGRRDMLRVVGMSAWRTALLTSFNPGRLRRKRTSLVHAGFVER